MFGKDPNSRRRFITDCLAWLSSKEYGGMCLLGNEQRTLNQCAKDLVQKEQAEFKKLGILATEIKPF